MNYRHIYHAGGQADLVKHLTLLHVLKRMADKAAPFCVIDSHAAIGLYDLNAEAATRTGEAAIGVFEFCRLPPSPALQPLQALLTKHNPKMQIGHDFEPATLKTYPGSPVMIHHFLRIEDRMIAVEKHPEDAKALREVLGFEARVHIHERDAWEALGALVPTPEKRLLVFIDPPYEKPDEMEQAFKAIRQAHMRMPGAIYALWYPIKDVVQVARWQDMFAESGISKIMRCDVMFTPEPVPNKMNGCGMMIINPPWQLDETLRDCMAQLMPLMIKGSPAAAIDWVAGE